MKYTVGKQSFCFSNFILLTAFTVFLSILSANLFSKTLVKNLNYKSSKTDSLFYYLEQLKKDINSNQSRTNLIEELIEHELYSFAWEQLQYLEPIDTNKLNLKKLKSELLSRFTPPTFQDEFNQQQNIKIVNLADSIKILVQMNSDLNSIRTLNQSEPNSPDMLNLSLLTNIAIGRKNQKAIEDEMERKRSENKINERNLEPMQIPKSNIYSKNINPLDFHKGLRIIPTSHIYHDNSEYQYLVGGVNTEVGLNNILGFGFNIQRGHIRIPEKLMRIKRVQVMLFLKPIANLMLSTNIGEDKIGSDSSPTADVSLKYEIFKNFNFKLTYIRNDASIVFNSHELINTRIQVNTGKISTFYNFGDEVQLSGYYEILRSNSAVLLFNGVRREFPTNLGNNLFLGIKKGFDRYITAGLEYFFSDFENTLPIYYSPQNYKHQNIFCEAAVLNSKYAEITVGGKLGYLFNQNSVLKEVYTTFSFFIYNGLRINIDGYFNLGKRYNDKYDSGSINISAFWSLIK